MSLKQRIALITGASRGIGRACLAELAKEGATVIGTATTQEGAEKISAYIQENNWEGYGLPLDIADTQSIDDTLKHISEKSGDINILINNAGITKDNLLMRMKPEEWHDVINTNLTSLFYICKAVLRPMMKARYGRIVNMASVVGVMGNAGQCNYAASKAGLIGFSKSLAREVGSRGITVNTVAPGFIRTDMTDSLSEELRQKMLEQIPLATLGEVKDIAECVLFLVQSRYITGETIHVNGGMYMN